MDDPVVLHIEITMDQFLEFDDEEGVVVKTVLGQSDGTVDDMYAPLSEMVDEIVEDMQITGDYGYLYSVSHELTMYASQIREAADRMENRLAAVGDLFDMDRGDLE